MFTDIVDSTRQQTALGDAAWEELLQRHHSVVRQVLARWQGIENDTAGDGSYATFDGPARGHPVRAPAGRSARRPRHRGVRAGLHTGECEGIDGKCAGIAVSIGARVAAEAGPSEVLTSSTVRDLVVGSGLTFEDAGEHVLKGLPHPWHLYRVVS